MKKNKYMLDLFRIGFVNIGDNDKLYHEGTFLSIMNIYQWADSNYFLKIKRDDLYGSQKESGIINYFEVERLIQFLTETLTIIDDIYENPHKFSEKLVNRIINNVEE